MEIFFDSFVENGEECRTTTISLLGLVKLLFQGTHVFNNFLSLINGKHQWNL